MDLHIPDLHEKRFFIHEFGEIKTANLIFNVPSPVARGGQEILMISIVIRNEEGAELRNYQGILEQFAIELEEIKDVYKGFYKDIESFRNSHQIYTKIEELLNSVYHSFPKQTIIMEPRDINLVMFDFFQEGKSRIAEILKEFISKGQLYEDPSDELTLLYSKISISKYSISIPNPLNFNKFLMIQLKNKDGFIFVVDATNKLMFKIAELTLNLILTLPEFAFTPSLIFLIDELGMKHLEIQRLVENLSINEDDNKIIRYISLNTSDNDEIREAIKWIVDRIAIKQALTAI
ncbi:MAG: hypothetical protein ACFFDN_26430 [Candidatus Hodarchaeota archaeon]